MSETPRTEVQKAVGNDDPQIVTGARGRYVLREEIGAGGMGRVYRADVVIDPGSKGALTEVAIKFMHREIEESSEASKQRFEREYKVLESLRGFPGIVCVEDWGACDDNHHFLAMEFVKDPMLDRLLEDNISGIPQMKAVQITLKILEILEPIHKQKFVHRDLKPQNIAICENPLSIRILDFGLAKPFEDGSADLAKVTQKYDGNKRMGTVHYMAPEQLMGQDRNIVDERADLYAVGVILYELLSGVTPFRGLSFADIVKQHQEKKEPEPLPYDIEGRRISHRLWRVIEKALSRRLEGAEDGQKKVLRYRTAEEFKADLWEVVRLLNRAERLTKDITSDYQLHDKIGKGTSAQVYKARRVSDGVDVAVKIVHFDASESTDGGWIEEMVLNETERTFDNDHIVRVLDAGLHGNRIAVVMELMASTTVEDLLKQYEGTGFPEDLFFRIMFDVCKGLHHAHAKNVMHRDVKPSNLLRTLDNRTKVGDFGLAKKFDKGGGSKATAIMGTAAYMAPEQHESKERIDHRADIYSVGVIMYEMLAGKLPFKPPFPVQHLLHDPEPLRIMGDFKNSIELAKLVEKCLQKDRELRPRSCLEIAQELKRIAHLAPQSAPQVPYQFRTQKEYNADKKTVATPGPFTRADTPKAPLLVEVARRPFAMVASVFVLALAAFGVYLALKPAPQAPVPPVPPPVAQSLHRLAIEGKWDEVATRDLGGADAEDLQLARTETRKSIGAEVKRMGDAVDVDDDGVKAVVAAFKHLGGEGAKVDELRAYQTHVAAIREPVAGDGYVAWSHEKCVPAAGLAKDLDEFFEFRDGHLAGFVAAARSAYERSAARRNVDHFRERTGAQAAPAESEIASLGLNSALRGVFDNDNELRKAFLSAAFSQDMKNWPTVITALSASPLGELLAQREVTDEVLVPGCTRGIRSAFPSDQTVPEEKAKKYAENRELIARIAEKLPETQRKRFEDAATDVLQAFKPEDEQVGDYRKAVAIAGRVKEATFAELETAFKRTQDDIPGVSQATRDDDRKKIFDEALATRRLLSLRLLETHLFSKENDQVTQAFRSYVEGAPETQSSGGEAAVRVIESDLGSSRYNAAWRATEGATITLVLSMPEGRVIDRLMVRGPRGVLGKFNADRSELTLTVAPKDAVQSPAPEQNGAIVLSVPISFVIDDGPPAGAVLVYHVENAEADFSSPKLANPQLAFDDERQLQSGRARLQIDVESGDKDAPSVVVDAGGKPLVLTKDARGSVFGGEIDLGSIAGLDRLSIAAKDAFENAAEFSWLLVDARTMLAASARRAIETGVVLRISNRSGSRDDSADALRNSGDALGKYKLSGLAEAVGRPALERLRAWYDSANDLAVEGTAQGYANAANQKLAAVAAAWGIPAPPPITSRVQASAGSQNDRAVTPVPQPFGPPGDTELELAPGISTRFIKVDMTSGTPVWMAATEFRIGEAQALGIWDNAITAPLSAGSRSGHFQRYENNRNRPVVICQDHANTARRVVDGVRRHAAAQLGQGAWAGNALVDLPTVAEWRAAAAKVGARYGWGDTPDPKSWRVVSGGVRREVQYDDLLPVTETGPFSGQVFMYLTGNVSELVRVGTSLKTLGGSHDDVDRNLADNILSLAGDPGQPDRYSGIRFVIRRR